MGVLTSMEPPVGGAVAIAARAPLACTEVTRSGEGCGTAER